MDDQMQQIREMQKATWNKFSPGWKKWDVFNMRFLEPMGDAIIAHLGIKDGDTVLDLATGTGEPGLTIAALTGSGKVIGTDLAEDMLLIAAENATAKGLDNYETMTADTCDLPFPDNSFDAISCRMGFMFFPDMRLAAREMHRVLRPGGRMAASVWASPQKNQWIGTMMKAVNENIISSPPPPGAPGMFRCSVPGAMVSLLTDAGFTGVGEKEITGLVDYTSAGNYWEMMMDVAAPVVAAMSKADETTKEKIHDQLFQSLHALDASGTSLKMGYAATLLFGKK